MAFFRCNQYNTIYGNGSLGDLVISADTNLSQLQVGGQTVFPSFAEDTGIFDLHCDNFTLNSGIKLIADKRNSAIIIRCRKNCTIRGTIFNNNAPKSLVDADGNDIAETLLAPHYPSWMIDHEAGGTGGSPSGSGQTGRFYGGGYGGGGNGGNCYSLNGQAYGGAGGSAQNIKTNVPNIFNGAGGGYVGARGVSHGGAGTHGGGGGGGVSCNWDWSRYDHVGGHGGSGAGANGGNSYDMGGTSPNEGGGGGGAGNIGGGVIIVYCRGTLLMAGTLNCNGGDGGDGGTSQNYNYYGTKGGGGGGGRIYLMHGGTYTNTGSCLVNAGTSGGSIPATNGTRYHSDYATCRFGGTPTSF